MGCDPQDGAWLVLLVIGLTMGLLAVGSLAVGIAPAAASGIVVGSLFVIAAAVALRWVLPARSRL